MGALDLTLYGIGSSVGAGVFSVVGIVALVAGPAVALGFGVAGLACALTGLAYAELAARVPAAGSSYTYSYVSFGELVGWLIGWNLTLEYGIVSACISRSFADYFAFFLMGIGAMSTTSPMYAFVAGFPLGSTICSPVAALHVLGLSALAAAGVVFSKVANMVVTGLNVLFLLFIIIAGASRSTSANWYTVNDSFVPYGFSSVIAAAGRLFFCFIGFDAVSCMAEETRKPRRDMPIGILVSLVVTTILYIAISLVLTAMVPFTSIDQKAPISVAFAAVGLAWAGDVASAGALFGTSACTLTAIIGQSRIFYRMARDGLWLPVFGRISHKTHAPTIGTLVVGAAAALLAFFTSLDALSSAISVGTLLAFCATSAGVVILRYKVPGAPRPWLAPTLVLSFLLLCLIASFLYIYSTALWASCTLWGLALVVLVVLACVKRLPAPEKTFACPLIPFVPCGSLAINTFMLAGLDWSAWVRVGAWALLGLFIYLCFGIWHSNLRRPKPTSPPPAIELAPAGYSDPAVPVVVATVADSPQQSTVATVAVL